MTPEQDRIIGELLENLAAEIERKRDRIPEHWNGIELRNYIKYVVETNFGYKMERSREKSYKNDLLIFNL